MKKTLLFFAFTILSITISFAQDKEDSNFGFSEKDIFLSGSITYNNTEQGDFENSFFSFSPSVGFFVSEHVALKGGLIVGSSKFDNTVNTLNSNERKSLGVSLGADYFFSPEKQFSFLLNLNASYERVSLEDNNGLDTDLNQVGFAFSPGINYFISDRFALQVRLGSLSYFSLTNSDGIFTDQKSFGLDLDLSNLGFGAIFKL